MFVCVVVVGVVSKTIKWITHANQFACAAIVRRTSVYSGFEIANTARCRILFVSGKSNDGEEGKTATHLAADPNVNTHIFYNFGWTFIFFLLRDRHAIRLCNSMENECSLVARKTSSHSGHSFRVPSTSSSCRLVQFVSIFRLAQTKKKKTVACILIAND